MFNVKNKIKFNSLSFEFSRDIFMVQMYEQNSKKYPSITFQNLRL